MIVIKAITIGLFLLVSKSVANICTGRYNGVQLANPSDCSSFYVCEYGEPKLFKCLDNLLYDPAKGVCNWAYMVNCGQTGETQPQTAYPTYSPTYSPHTEQTYTTSYGSTDYSETDEFFPGLIETIPNVFNCINPGFYFAPHPRSCEKYFICENYRIHYHQCGEGIYWDYVYNQCDFPVKSFCYSAPYTATSTPSTTTSTTSTTTVGKEPGNVIECPDGSQSFIGDPDDCHKYYICIGGIPIATSCPENMAWDKDMSQCNEDAWLKCFG